MPRSRPIQLHADIASQPGTPNLKPVMSLSSSIASLDPLSRSFPPSPAIQAISERFSAMPTIGSPLGQELKAVAEAQASEEDGLEADDWEEVEVGKGLAHYNSVEIDRIKGMKR